MHSMLIRILRRNSKVSNFDLLYGEWTNCEGLSVADDKRKQFYRRGRASERKIMRYQRYVGVSERGSCCLWVL